jgi:hypothetical protein
MPDWREYATVVLVCLVFVLIWLAVGQFLGWWKESIFG